MNILKIKEFIRRLLVRNNIWVGKVTDEIEIINFFKKIRPVTTNFELIRIGGEGDGGYLIPDDLSDIDACFSPGVSNTSDFENELSIRGIKCFLADYSVEGPPIINDLFDFEKKFLGPSNLDMHITLESWIENKFPDLKNGILQMDIEGSEYSVLFETSPEILTKFKIIIIEFHGLEKIFNKIGYDFIFLIFTKLINDFEVVHIHPNNSETPFRFRNLFVPPVMEFTFLRKDRCLRKIPCTTFPHVLDRKNNCLKPDYPLPNCWYNFEI
jgi:hypothetical protein